MKIDEIFSAVNQLNSTNIYELLYDMGLKVSYCDALNKRKLDATLSDNIIPIKSNLEPEHEHFVLFHEYGHYLLHSNENRTFSFYLSKYKNKLENEANIFAFLCMMKDEYLYDVDVVSLAIHKGIPERIAISVYEHLINHYNLLFNKTI